MNRKMDASDKVLQQTMAEVATRQEKAESSFELARDYPDLVLENRGRPVLRMRKPLVQFAGTS